MIPLMPSVKLENVLIHQNLIVILNGISYFSKTIEELESTLQEEKDKDILQATSGMHTKIIIILRVDNNI